MSTLLVFDIGTSSVKAGLFDRTASSPIWLHREPLSPAGVDGWLTEHWTRAIQATLDANPLRERPDAVVLSGNGPTIVPVAEDRTAVADALLWFDRREERIDGQPSFFLPKIAWLQQHEPELARRTRMFMTCPEYLAHLLGCDPHSTSPSQMFDRYVWDEEGARAYGVPKEKLPPLVRPGALVGTASRTGSQLFGIPAGVTVIAGGPDFLMSLLGTASTRPGRTCDRAGTSEGINHCLNGATQSPDVRCLPHVVPGLWNAAGVLSSTGRIFEWYRTISRQQSVGYERMLAEIAAAGFDHEPYFFPSMHRGAAWEFSRGMLVGLRSDHTSAHMGRGVVHSIGYAVRQSIESLRSAGCDVTELRACGGQAKNAIWNQMKADITGVPIVVPEVLDAELIGDLCCARVGLGDFDSPAEAAEAVVRLVDRFEPDVARYRQFTDGYGDYLDVYERFLHASHP